MVKKWNYAFDVPDQKKVRMIIYTDCKNEADDQFAVAHHLMTPKFIVKGITAGHFNKNPQEYGEGRTAQASLDEIHKVLELMGLDGKYPVYKGAEYPLMDERTPQPSEAADFIIQEAMRDDPHPLYIACMGAVTDLASAILKKPEICGRMTAIWIGGGIYPEGCPEFNLDNDMRAANVLFESSMPVWQIPMDVYKQMSVTLAELQWKVKPCGELGRYLFEQMAAYNDKTAHISHWPHGECWGLGDSPTVGVLFFEGEKTDVYEEIPAPRFNYENSRYDYSRVNPERKIRVYKDANARLTLEDFFAKLQLNFGARQ